MMLSEDRVKVADDPLGASLGTQGCDSGGVSEGREPGWGCAEGSYGLNHWGTRKGGLGSTGGSRQSPSHRPGGFHRVPPLSPLLQVGGLWSLPAPVTGREGCWALPGRTEG